MHDYKKIVRKLVGKSFPRLSKRWIVVHGVNFQWKRFYAVVTYLGLMAWIVVFPLGKKCTKKGLEGVLAHELAHFEIIINMSILEKIKFGYRWLFFKKWKAWFETAADKYAIDKGYARGLYENVFRAEKKMTKKRFKYRSGKGYLSAKQIKDYAVKVGKW